MVSNPHESNWRESEKCGVVGMVGHDVSLIESLAMQEELKHRGNGPAGFATYHNDGSTSREVADKIDDLLTSEHLTTAQVFIGHNRYATSGSKEISVD